MAAKVIQRVLSTLPIPVNSSSMNTYKRYRYPQEIISYAYGCIIDLL